MKIETKEELEEFLMVIRRENQQHCIPEDRVKVSVVINVGGACDGRCCIESTETVTGG